MAHILEAERPEDYLHRLAASDLGRAYKALALDELAIYPGASVVDLGCGPGADLIGLADAVGPSGQVLGIDHDASAVAAAARLASNHPQISVVRGDAHHLDLPARSVDRVHTDRVLQHVADPDAVLAEVARVLRPGGIVGLAEPDWDTLIIDYPQPDVPDAYRRFITDKVVRNSRIGRQLPAMCERNGLAVERVIPVTAVFRDIAQADRVFGFQRVTRRAVDARYLTAESAEAWLNHLRNEPLFVAVTLFFTIAEAQSEGRPQEPTAAAP